MLSLTRIFLHNWHRFTHHVIDVEDSLYLAGHNGSGKSSVLDAIQLVLVADRGRIEFNKTAQDHSDRDLDTYVRGKIGEARWLRPGATVAYVALEFREPQRRNPITLGVCLEADAGKETARAFFIVPEALEPHHYVGATGALTRRELKQALRGKRGAQTFEQIGEYQAEMRNRLGGLNERFIDLFLRALHFRPIGNIDTFVEQWLLEKRSLSLETLQTVRERLSDLRQKAEQVSMQLERLEAITVQQREVLRLMALRDQYRVLVVLLRAAGAKRQVQALAARLVEQQANLKRAEAGLAEAEVAHAGARQALEVARRRLYESDLVRQRDDLVARIHQATREADGIRDRWQALRHELAAEPGRLADVPTSGILDEGDGARLQTVFDRLVGLGAVPPPTSALQGIIASALPLLETAAERALTARVQLDLRIKQLRQEGTRLEREIQELVQQGTIRYEAHVERLQELLRPVVGGKPKLLCELIEVSEARWQDAVEAMLGARRFNIIVAPEHFDAAVAVLDRARSQEKLYEAGLVDLARAAREARAARPGSLAEKVMSATPAVAAYINTILGDVMAVDTAAELRGHRRAVTPEVVVYAEYSIRAVRPSRYQPSFIGQQARRSQIASRRVQLDQVGRELAASAPQVQAAEAWARLLDYKAKWALFRDRAGVPLDDRPLRDEIAVDQETLAKLDLSGVAELEAEVARLEGVERAENEAERRAIEHRTETKTGLAATQTQLREAERVWSDQQAAETAAREHFPETIIGAETLLAERLTATDLDDEARKAESKAKEFDTRAGNETEALTELGTAYNTTFKFSAAPRNPREARYGQERERLAATELPDYQNRINQAEREAEHELREHVLHTLREQIGEAKRKLEQINDALDKLPAFGHESYRFKYERADDVHEFYELITADSQLLGRGPLLESAFYREHQAAFDRFYEALTRRPGSEAERRDQERLTDYRHYLAYDIVIRDTVTGQESRLSRIMSQTSGGETQTPIYLTIAASFVQLYNIGQRSGRPTIRLVAFDEAFSKMDQERIGATLDLFQHFNLQIITATPLERCEYLVPKLCTSLVLTAVRDTVLVEPYRNYAARLGGMNGH
jgi:uncharacterized protein YPO0396